MKPSSKLHAVEQPTDFINCSCGYFRRRDSACPNHHSSFKSDAEKENRPLVNRHDSGAKVLDVDEVIRRSERLPDADNKY